MIYPLLISLSGIFFGYLLGRIAPEEIKPGMKYLYSGKVLLFFLGVGYIIFSLYNNFQIFYLVAYFLLCALLYFLIYKIKNKYLWILPFIFLIGPYFLLDEMQGVPIVAVSAKPPDTAIPETKAKGFDGFISKPINYLFFAQQIASVIEGQSIWVAR